MKAIALEIGFEKSKSQVFSNQIVSKTNNSPIDIHYNFNCYAGVELCLATAYCYIFNVRLECTFDRCFYLLPK